MAAQRRRRGDRGTHGRQGLDVQARIGSRLLALIVSVTALLAWSAGPAFAHDEPVAFAPSDGSLVTEQPTVFRVTMNEPILNLGGSSSVMQVTGPSGADEVLYYGDGCVSISGPTIETEAQLGPAGRYTVAWQVVSSDGHPTSGEYSFTWQPADGQESAEGTATPGNCGVTAGSGGNPTDTDSPSGPATSGWADVAWIAGAFGAVLVVVAATVLLIRRKPAPPSA